MTDAEMARALERGELPPGGFHHADHLRVGLVYLDETPSVAAAIERMAGTLRSFAEKAGVPQKFSRPLTDFWMYQLASARAVMPEADADAIFAAWPRLLDRDLARGGSER